MNPIDRGARSRRALIRGAVLAPLATAVGWGAWRLAFSPRPQPTLLSEGVVVGAGGVVRPLPPGASCRFEPGTRVPAADPAAAAEGGAGRASSAGRADDSAAATGGGVLSDEERTALVRAARERVAGAALPGGRRAGAARDALADLLALIGPVLADADGSDPISYPAGAVVAGPVSAWRYVWPRDASFAAAALSAVGLDDEALTVLEHLAALQGVDGGFEARYTAAGTVPDDRPAQLDGTGWVMWAAGRVLGAARPDADRPDADRPDADRVEGRLGVCLRRCASRLLELTDGPHRLPPVSPDYWEVAEGRLTLDTAMSVLLGLEAAARLVAAGLDLGAEGEATAARAVQVRAAIEGGFAPGWGRHRGDDDVDAAIALTAPPFTAALRGAVEVRRGARERMARVSGGVGPGSSWRDDGVSWTPETALLAWSAAALGAGGETGLAAEADELLDWLVDRRTGVGALPEKVAADGSPAGPAPLAWTCSLLLLALCESDRGR